MMKILFTILVIILLISFTAGCGIDEEEPGTSVIDWNDHDLRAEQFVNALLNGDYTIAAENFDEEMKKALDINALRRNWLNTVRVAGEFISIEGTETFMHEGYEINDVVMLHKNRSINTRVVFSQDGLVAGLFFSFI